MPFMKKVKFIGDVFPGNAYNFSGIELVTMTTIGSFERTQTFKYKARVKNGSSGSAVLTQLWSNQSSPNFKGVSIYIFRPTFVEGNKIGISLTSSGGNRITVLTPAVFTPTDFKEIDVDYDGSSTAAGLTLKIDGVVTAFTVSNDALSASIIDNTGFRIGGHLGTPPTANSFVLDSSEFHIDGVQVFKTKCDDNGTLTCIDLSGQGNDGVIDLDTTPRVNFFIDIIPRNGLVAEYLANNNFLDTSGNGYNGVNNNVTFGPDRNSIANSAFVLNGTDAFINIDAALAELSTTTKGTWSCWVKPVDATPSSPTDIIVFGDTNAGTYIIFQLHSNLSFRVALAFNGVDKWVLETDENHFADNVWTHLAVVQDGISAILYVGGVDVNQTFKNQIDKTIWFNNQTGIDNGRIGDRNMGSNGEANHFDGSIDDVRIYDRNLSQAEITALSNE